MGVKSERWYAYYVSYGVTNGKERGYYVVSNGSISILIGDGMKFATPGIDIFRRIGGKKIRVGLKYSEAQVIIRSGSRESFLDGKIAADFVNHLRDLLRLIRRMGYVEDDEKKVVIIRHFIEPLLNRIIPILRWE